MKNKILALKYRPQEFKDLIGQEVMSETITNAIKLDKTPNAYLLTGIRGVGKTTTARLIAKALNCEKNNNPKTKCDANTFCITCQEIVNSNHIDILEMDAASKTGIDDVRELIENSKYSPTSANFKIFIIDEVHMLSKQAFNGLLKTLEEPPSRLKFILATTEARKIPVTILSRCQRFDLKRVESENLAKHLKKISEQEKINIDDNAIALLVRAGDGSVRDAISLLDQAIINNNINVTAETVTSMLGLADREKIYDLLEKITEGNVSESLNIFRSLYNSGADILMIYEELLNAIHSITQIKISPDIKNNITIPEIERVRGTSFANQLSMHSLGIMWQVLFRGFQELQSGYHLLQLGEMILIRLIFISDRPNPEDFNKKILDKNENNDKLIKENPEIKKKVNLNNNLKNITNSNNNTKETSVIKIDNFRQFVDFFYKKREALLHTQLYNSVQLISFKEGEVVLNTSLIRDQHFNRNVAKMISRWTGRIWQVHSSDSNIGSSLSEEDIIDQQNEIKKMKNQPEVKRILEALPGLSIHSITDITETVDETIDEFKPENQKEV